MPRSAPPRHAPHPHLERYYRDESDRRRFLDRLFDEGAPYYEGINAAVSLGSGVWYRRHALRRAGLEPGMTLLDVACGTGPVCRAARKLIGDEGRILGLDPSHGMLRAGGHAEAQRVQGLAEGLPFADETFDFLSMGYALRHVPDLETAFEEYFRVLKPGGRVLLLELTPPTSSWGRKLVRNHLGVVIPKLTRLVTRSEKAELMMEYYWETIDQCVPPEVIVDALRSCGFEAEHLKPYPLTSEYRARPPS